MTQPKKSPQETIRDFVEEWKAARHYASQPPYCDVAIKTALDHEMPGDNNEADSKFIAHATNNSDRLLKALEVCVEALDWIENEDCAQRCKDEAREALNKAAELLAKEKR